jgi:hypothetical protein
MRNTDIKKVRNKQGKTETKLIKRGIKKPQSEP